MIRYTVIGVAAVLTGLAASAPAADATVGALRNQVKALRTQETATVKALRAQYDLIIKRDRLTEEVLKRERHALDVQEKELLALTVPEEHAAIRQHYHALRRYLTGEVKLDEAQVKKLHQMKEAHATQIKGVYQAKIKAVEAEIKVLERAKAKKGQE